MAERYQLQGAAALVRIAGDHTVPFRLINPTSQPVTLEKGATLGTFSEAYGDSGVLISKTFPDYVTSDATHNTIPY